MGGRKTGIPMTLDERIEFLRFELKKSLIHASVTRALLEKALAERTPDPARRTE